MATKQSLKLNFTTAETLSDYARCVIFPIYAHASRKSGELQLKKLAIGNHAPE